MDWIEIRPFEILKFSWYFILFSHSSIKYLKSLVISKSQEIALLCGLLYPVVNIEEPAMYKFEDP